MYVLPVNEPTSCWFTRLRDYHFFLSQVLHRTLFVHQQSVSSGRKSTCAMVKSRVLLGSLDPSTLVFLTITALCPNKHPATVATANAITPGDDCSCRWWIEWIEWCHDEIFIEQTRSCSYVPGTKKTWLKPTIHIHTHKVYLVYL